MRINVDPHDDVRAVEILGPFDLIRQDVETPQASPVVLAVPRYSGGRDDHKVRVLVPFDVDIVRGTLSTKSPALAKLMYLSRQRARSSSRIAGCRMNRSASSEI